MSVSDRISALTPEQRGLFELLRQKKAAPPPGPAGTLQPPPVLRRTPPSGEGDWPLSLDQERLWFMHELDPENTAFNVDAASRMRGPLHIAAMAGALNEIVRRHAAWRTTFNLVDGNPVQRVAPHRVQEVSVVDLSGLPEESREPEALRLLAMGTRALFDLERGPLVRVCFLRLAERDHMCLLTVHHLVTDWITFQIVWSELAVLYDACLEGRPSPLPETPVQYPDYAVWQREWLRGEVLDGLVRHWRQQLEGFPLVLELPTDRPRPPIQRMHGGRRTVALGRELAEGLRALARREGTTSFMAVMALAYALLHRFSGQEKIILGSNNANRNRPEIDPVIGYFLTQVPFAVDLSGDPTFRELLARVRRASLDAYAHQDLPFGKLVEALQPERDTSRPPLIQTQVLVLDGQYNKSRITGLEAQPVSVYDGNARYDLMFGLYDYADTIAGPIEYDADVFDGSTVERLAGLFVRMAEAGVADPGVRLSRLPALSEAARHQVLAEWNDTARPAPGWTVPERFAEQAALAPDTTALVFGGQEITYGELGRRSAALARALRNQGVGREDRVALVLERSPDLVAALLAVWRAGGACVPLDPASPPDRLAALLDDAQPKVVIDAGSLPAEEEVSIDLAVAPIPGDLAYLIYTSGTTGLPKAVMVEHGSLANTLASLMGRFGFAAEDRMPHLARFSFDIALFELLAPILSGGACELLTGDEVLEPEVLLDAVERATRVHAVPSLMRQIAAGARARGPERFAGLRTLLTGGDLVPPELVAELLEVFPRADVAVLYGPTEATVVCTAWPVPRGERPGRTLIGRPLDNVEVRVADGHGEPVPLGVPGELWVGGPGVARGYLRGLKRPELAAERFVEVDGSRFYRTGDLVRQLASQGGVLEFLGRTDNQVKIRGFRIEPGEVEAALAAHPGVREAVVAAVAAVGETDKRLVAWCVPAGPALSAEALREHLAARLPAYMVPSVFVLLPELPLTAHGKVDRARLPVPSVEQDDDGALRTLTEELVAGVWCEVLGRARVGRHADFFELGGHSLLATQVVSRLRAAAGVELPVRALFQSPTVAALAAALEDEISAGHGLDAPPIVPLPRELREDPPLSFAQERLWFLDRLTGGTAAYNIPLALVARGGLSLPAMEAALGAMVRRQEALRTTFDARGDRPVQVIAPPSPWSLPLIDLSALSEGALRGEVRRLAGEAVARPFDLERDPVLRASAVRLAPDEHTLLLVVHHIAADGWSVGVMVEEIAALYPAALAGAASPLPELAVQYADFAVWQREWLQGEVLERQLAYWRERLAGAPVIDLPTDRPRPPVQNFRGATRMHAIGPETAGALESLARRHDATHFMVLLAAVQTLLGRYAGQDDVVVGSPIANRTRAEIEPLIGFFVNSLVLRGDLSNDPGFAALIARSRRSALEAYSHQDLPFERLVEELRPERRLSHNPLFQVMFAVQNAPLRPVELPGLTFSPVELEIASTRFDLEVFFTEVEEGLAVQLTYSTDLFDATTILRLAGQLDALLAAVLQDPSLKLSEIPLLTAPERHQLLSEWNDTAAALPGQCVPALFAEQARLRPGAVAVSSEAGELTYAELDRRSSRLARRLAAAGIGPEVRVALLAQRSPAMVVGLLGILKAGGVYVPLDPSYPVERLAWMIADSEARVLLGQPELLADLPEGIGSVPWIELTADPGDGDGSGPPEPLPDGLAYVMYTSGSTGRPKGVGVTHRNVVRLVRESGFADLGPEQVFLQLAPISFDASTLEIWAPLLNGGRLAVFPPRRPSLEELGEAVARWGVTSLWLTAGLFHQMVDDRLGDLRPLRQLLAGGDVLSPPHARRALAGLPGTTLINGYGPTEGTTFTCCFPMTGPEQVGPTVPLGRPVGNTRVYVLGPDLRPVPAGVWGELCAAGGGLARGYLNRPDLTAERFVPDPFATEPGARLYRTGDVVRFRPDGRVEFLGRRDGQVKLRGFRIELGEIESALARHPAVRESAVVAQDDGGPAGRRLVAYVVPRPAEEERSADDPGHQHVEQWRELYEQTYVQGPPPGAAGDAAFNIQGWNSSYTGEPIPAGEMREWLEGTVGRLLALEHRRVLEVGCGTGLLLFRVAPEAESYRGTDFSAVALAQVRAELGRRGLPQVELAQGLADDWTGISPGEFDLVVLNSVVQYFPGVDYLIRVLEGAVAATASGGAVFVGDVRSLPLLEAFHLSVQLHRASGALPVAELMRRVRRRVADEEELVIDPALFRALARRLPRVSGVQVLLKRGRQANELTRFRYDVILYVEGEWGGRPQPGEGIVSSLADLERCLADAPEAVAVSGLPNARLAAEYAALELLAGAGREMETVEELRAEIALRAGEAGATDPEEVWALADRLGYDADLTWSEDPGRFYAVLRRRGAGVRPGVPSDSAAEKDLPWSAWANDPLRADQARRLVPELRRALETELPEYMVPSAFVLLDALPLTPNGKVDRAALPALERSGTSADDAYVAPSTPLEERIACVAAEVLGVEKVGMRDNFFDLGGHSLLATQLVSRLTQENGVPVTLQMVFDSATLADLADRVVEEELRSADGELLDEALAEMEALSDEELQALLGGNVR